MRLHFGPHSSSAMLFPLATSFRSIIPAGQQQDGNATTSRSEAFRRLAADGIHRENSNAWVVEKLKKLNQARSRLYRNRILQVHTRWKALAEIYTMDSFAPFPPVKYLSKIRSAFPQFFANSDGKTKASLQINLL